MAGDGEADRRADGKLVAGVPEHLGDLALDDAVARPRGGGVTLSMATCTWNGASARAWR